MTTLRAVPDWPDSQTDPGFHRPPSLHDFRDDRDRLETLVLRGLCWWANQKTVAAALGMLTRHDFRSGTHGDVFDAIVGLHYDRQSVSLADLADVLEGTVRFSRLLPLFSTDYPGDPRVYAGLLGEWARRDRLMATVKQLPGRVIDGTIDPDLVVESLARDMPDREYGIDRVEDLEEDIDVALAVGDMEQGERVGWPSLADKYRVEPGLWTVVTGLPSAGKSTLVDNVCVHLARQGWRFAMFSPESAPTPRHVARLVRIFVGKPVGQCTIDEVEHAKRWVAAHFEWVKSTEEVTITEILRRADVIHRRDPINGLVVDPFNEVDRDHERESETLRISEALSQVRRWGRRRSVHVWVIAHPTKMQRDRDGAYLTPTLYDVSGSATWKDKADMGLVVSRKMDGGPTSVSVVKVRFAAHGKLGTARLQFDPLSERFYEQRRPV